MDKKNLVIWDVGLGAGTNAMAVIHELGRLSGELQHECDTHLVSFEIDLDPMRLALKNHGAFPYLRHAAPHAILTDREWIHEPHRLKWTLYEGDFLKTFQNAPAPDLVFYDPFSYKTDSKLWNVDTFRSLARHFNRPMKLMTYSASNIVRASLLAEGFFVAYGTASGPKAHTTIAFNDAALAKEHGNLLGQEWLATWNRSGANTGELQEQILKHPQFQLTF